ncbi:hypothetical protein Hanom_Chr13g01231201 [Helianthus anomalus]
MARISSLSLQATVVFTLELNHCCILSNQYKIISRHTCLKPNHHLHTHPSTPEKHIVQQEPKNGLTTKEENK